MKEYSRSPVRIAATLLTVSMGTACAATAQQPAERIGPPLGVVTNGQHAPMSDNVKVFGAVVSAESCSYDPSRDLIVVVNRGVDPSQVENDGFISFLNHDGSVHTPSWIAGNRAGVVMNQPLGSEIFDGKLYVADRVGGTGPNDPTVSLVRWFDIRTGETLGEVRTDDSGGFNDIAVLADGTIYGTQTRAPERVYRINPDGSSEVFAEGAPLALPNGVAIDNDGNIVVVNTGDDAVITYAPSGAVLRVERAAQPGSDGIVIMPDGTKYVSSVREGGVSRIRPGGTAELIARNIPNAASMCYDAGAHQLVIPMNANNSVAIVPLD